MTDAVVSPPPSLRHSRPFWTFWLARVLLTGGFQILTVAIGWQVYAITGRALDLGLVGLLQFLPRVLLVLVTGSAADRYDRRAIVAISMAVQALVSAVLLLGSLGAGFHISRELIFVLSVLIGICRAFDMPTMQSLLPNLVPSTLLAPAIALAASANEAATIIAPALGGLLFAHKRTAAGAMDTNMAMLILLAPVFPYAMDMGKSVTYALAVVSGPALAWLVYRCIYPTNAQSRMRTLARMMVAEVPQLAQRIQGAQLDAYLGKLKQQAKVE